MNQNVIPGLFFVATLVVGYLYITGDAPQEYKGVRPEIEKNAVSYKEVRMLKDETAARMDIRRQEAQVRKQSETSLLQSEQKKQEKLQKNNRDDELGPAADDLHAHSTHKALTLDQRMDAFLAQRAEFEAMERAKKQAYVEQFKKEAKAMGYHVVIDENMEIIKVEKTK